jgi:hypothetical protein
MALSRNQQEREESQPGRPHVDANIENDDFPVDFSQLPQADQAQPDQANLAVVALPFGEPAINNVIDMDIDLARHQQRNKVANMRFLMQVAYEIQQTFSQRQKRITRAMFIPALAGAVMCSALIPVLLVSPPDDSEYTLPNVNFNSQYQAYVCVAFIMTLIAWAFDGFLSPLYFAAKERYRPATVASIYQAAVVERINLTMSSGEDFSNFNLYDAQEDIQKKIEAFIAEIYRNLGRDDVETAVTDLTSHLSAQINKRASWRVAGDQYYRSSMVVIQTLGIWDQLFPQNSNTAFTKEILFNAGFLLMNLHAMTRTQRFNDKPSNISSDAIPRILTDFQKVGYREASEYELTREKSALLQLNKFQAGLTSRKVSRLSFFRAQNVELAVIGEGQEVEEAQQHEGPRA